MIGYRHWLELRWRLPWVIALGALLGVWPAEGLFENLDRWGTLPGPGAGDEAVWGSYVSRLWLLSLTGPILLAGNGFRTWYMDSINPSDVSLPFTLTLPVSRPRLMWTRLASSWLALLGSLLAAAAAQTTYLMFARQSIPWVPMAASTITLGAAALSWVVVAGALLMPARLIWGIVAYPAAVLVIAPFAMSAAMTSPPGGQSPWLAMAALATSALLAFAYMRRAARTREVA